MGELKFNLDKYDLEDVKLDCPFKKKGDGPYGYTSYYEHPHDSYNMPAEYFPCDGKGPSLVDVVEWLVRVVDRLDAQLNPRTPEPEPKPKKRVVKKKVS